MNKLRFAIVFALILVPAVFSFVHAQSLNPIKANSIEELFAKVIDAVIVVLMPFVVLAVIYSGFLFLIARGNKETLSKAKTNFVWVIVGVSVLLGAKIISFILKSTVEQIVK